MADRGAPGLHEQLGRPIVSPAAGQVRLVNHVAGELDGVQVRCDRCGALLFDQEKGPFMVGQIAPGMVVQRTESTDVLLPARTRNQCRLK